jgi:hypothetical protein
MSDNKNWAGAAALAAAGAIGSAALAAALIYTSRRKGDKPAPQPKDAPETD